jgi:phosphocarrier protein HPr
MQENQAYQEREATLSNVQGLHMRPVMRLADVAAQFQSRIRIKKDDMDVDGKSPMELMLLAAPCGTKLLLCADGADSAAALDALIQLINEKFNED